MIFETIKFVIYSLLIVIISKYVLVKILRKLAEALNLSAKAIGNIAGIATSVPELLTVSFSAFAGLVGASVYNILSSNIINFVQYIISIYTSKNQRILTENKAIKIDLGLVIFTILIPIAMILVNIDFNINIVPIFILLFFLYYYINEKVHQLYLKRHDKKISKQIEEEQKWVRGKTKVVVKYSIYLLLTSIILYLIGDSLSRSLENLAQVFAIPEFVLGITLGFITSIPELIIFFESQKYYKNEKNNEAGVIEATNNLLTSNILNLFVIQTIGIVIYWLIM